VDKGAFGLHVTDREGLEPGVRGVGMVCPFQACIYSKVAGGGVVVFAGGFGGTKRHGNVMHPPSLRGRKSEREPVFPSCVQKQFFGTFSQIASRAADLCHRPLNRAAVPARPGKADVITGRPTDVFDAEDQDIVAANHEQVA
jgi:hypothetical protein